MITEPEEFENLKRIAKELLFWGASRTAVNIDDQTPLDIIEDKVGILQVE